MELFCLFLMICGLRIVNGKSSVIVAGSTGYIGRAVVKELVSRGISTYALVRNEESISDITKTYLKGANILQCNVLIPKEVDNTILKIKPKSVINCLASRNGLGKESFEVDYGAGANLLQALQYVGQTITKRPSHYVMLSAFCCGKPELQFQFAKLKLEEEIQHLTGKYLTHSIIRPTAYFKSLDGQIEAAKKGNPVLYFGSGTCAANAISEEDLAAFLVDSAINPKRIGMLNEMRNIGGPDVPPITKLQQINLIFDVLEIPIEKRKTISLPLGVFQVLLSLFGGIKSISSIIGLENIAQKCEDASEIVKIVRYYATEPMVAIQAGEVQGKIKLRDHFCNIAGRGGCLVEVDQYTTTTGVLDLVLKNDYVKTK